MATSPNYGWLEPDNTDLVKNGALAIRTLGNAIDTTMATMTPKSLVDAKGDLIAATANDTPARLAVGADGSTLVANSAAATGLSWAGQPYANPVLNSAMQIAQRGTSISVAANTRAYTLDRWDSITNPNQACTISRQATGDTTNLPNIQYALRFQRNSGQTGTGVPYLANSFETVNSIPYAGKTVTFSFYARAGANYSAASNVLSASVATGTGTDQAILGGYTGTLTPITVSATLTTTWQRFSGTATLSSSMNEMSVYFNYTPTGTASTNDYFEVTGVQIDLGSVALPFRTAYGTIAGELAACQRYYVRLDAGTTNYNPITPIGGAASTTSISLTLQPPTTMRTAPSSIEYANMSVYGGSSSGFGFLAVSTLTLIRATGGMLELNATVSGATAGGLYRLQPNNAAGYVGVVAEL